MLQDLPVELIELVLRECDTTSFIQVAKCSRFMNRIATSSRDLILHQLSKTAGERNYFDPSLLTPDLIEIFVDRAKKGLCGAEFHSSFKYFQFDAKSLKIDSRSSETLVLNNRASNLLLDPYRNAAIAGEEFLLTFKDNPTVYLFDMGNKLRTFTCRLPTPGSKLGTIEILHTFFTEFGVYVLYRLRPFIDQQLDLDHPFVKHAMDSNPNGGIFLAYHRFNLVHFSLGRSRPRSLHSTHIFGFPQKLEHEPLAFTAFGESTFAISWQHSTDIQNDQVILYDIDLEDLPYEEEEEEDEEDEEDEEEEEEADHDEEEKDRKYADQLHQNWISVESSIENAPLVVSKYDSLVLQDGANRARPHVDDRDVQISSDWISSQLGPPVKLKFNDRGRQLLSFHRGRSLYSSYQILPAEILIDQTPSIKLNKSIVQFSDEHLLMFSVGIPFYSSHIYGDRTTPGSRCTWNYLALGIAKHRVQNWSVACILKAESAPLVGRCNHTRNFERGRRLDNWTIQFKLGGFQESITSSGSVIAYSNAGTRIAVASWKTVTVWAIDEHHLDFQNYSAQSGLEQRSMRELSESYSVSWETPNGHIELRPIVIHLDAVCSQLFFRNGLENELLAITDRGVMHLKLDTDTEIRVT